MVQGEVSHNSFESGLQVFAADVLLQNVLTAALKNNIDEMRPRHPVDVSCEQIVRNFVLVCLTFGDRCRGLHDKVSCARGERSLEMLKVEEFGN